MTVNLGFTYQLTFTSTTGHNVNVDGKQGGRAVCGAEAEKTKLQCLHEKHDQCKTWCE